RDGAVFFFLSLFVLLAFFVGFFFGAVAFARHERLHHREFFTLEDTLGTAAGVAQVDVVALHVVFLIAIHPTNGVNNAAIGSEGEGGHVFVDVDGRFFQVLRAGRGRKKERNATERPRYDRDKRRAQTTVVKSHASLRFLERDFRFA